MATSTVNLTQIVTLLASHSVDFSYQRLQDGGIGEVKHYIIAGFSGHGSVRINFSVNSRGERVFRNAAGVYSDAVLSVNDLFDLAREHNLYIKEQEALPLPR